MSFLGSRFSLESVVQNGIASIRVQYTQDPRREGDGALTDSLTAGNYRLTGPTLNYVVGGSMVPGSPQCVDLSLAAPIIQGSWTLTVANVKSDTGTSLVQPTSLAFTTARLIEQEPVSHGAKNDSTEALVRKFLNPALKGDGWVAFVSAVATGDRLVHNNAHLAFDQLFLTSARGRYLDRRASDRGVSKPHNVGMTDDTFRELAVVLANNKVVPESVLEVLEVFYGEEAIRAYSTSELPEPYFLNDGEDLTLVFNGLEQYTINFFHPNFARMEEALAVEVAAVISRRLEELGSQAYAVSFRNNTDGKNYLRIYSGRRGIGSSVQVIGGRAQLGLRLPQPIFDTNTPGAMSWSVVQSPDHQSRLRFTTTMSVGAPFDMNNLREGDVAYIYGVMFPEPMQGSFVVKAVDVTYGDGEGIGTAQAWFEVENPEGTALLAGTTGSYDTEEARDLTFFRPVRRTPYDDTRCVVVNQQDGRLSISLPATSQLVTRDYNKGAYLNDGAALQVTGVTRVGPTATFTTSVPHDLHTGDFVDIEGVFGSDDAPVTAGTAMGALGSAPSTATGTTDACAMSHGTSMNLAVGNPAICQWGPGAALLVGGMQFTSTTEYDSAPMLLRVTGQTATPSGISYTYRWDALNLTLGCGTQGPAVLRLSDDTILAYGGLRLDGETYCTGSIVSHDASWNVTAKSVTGGPQLNNCAVAQTGNRVLVIGGYKASPHGPTDEVWGVPLGGSELTLIGNLIEKRFFHGACTLPNGKILVFGGNGVDDVPLTSCEVYDTDDNTSVLTGSMAVARRNPLWVQLDTGCVLVMGGLTSTSSLASCEMYDPTTGRWQMVSDMPQATDSLFLAHVPSRHAVYVTYADGSVWYMDTRDFTWHVSHATVAATTGVFTNAGGCVVQDDLIVCVNCNIQTSKSNLIGLGEEVVNTRGLNTRLQVSSVISTTRFSAQVVGDGYFTSSSQEATAIAARAGSTVLGPYVFDLNSGFSVTGVVQTTAQVLNETISYSVLSLDTSLDPQPALAFPDGDGWLVFSFGDDQQVGPVRYLGRQGDASLRLDASFKFPTTLPAGITVTLVLKTQYTKTSHAFWATDSSAGRLAAIGALGDTVASGVVVELDVKYPDDQGLGNSGCPTAGAQKLADKVWIWGGDDADAALEKARNE